MGLIATIVSNIGVGAILKLFKGISEPIAAHYKSKDIQDTARQGLWSNTLMHAATADVEHRRLAQEERAGSPALMFLFLNILGWPTLYFSLFWADTIFGSTTWSVPLTGWVIMDWTTFELTRAPERLELYGKEVIQWGFGFGASTMAVVKGAKILKSSGLIGKGR